MMVNNTYKSIKMFYREILKDLEKWRNSDLRKPMILRGARQVGKTTVVNEFGKQFKQYLYISLEEKKYQDLFQVYDGIEELTSKLFLMKPLRLLFFLEHLVIKV